MSYQADSPKPSSYHILVIEDDDPDWKLIDRALSKSKTVRFEATRVSHLNNGLTVLRHRRYDAVLLDLILQYDGPVNGLDTVIQVVKEASDTPIVVLTTLGDIEMAVQAIEYGAASYIEKPPESHRLESTLRQAIERHIRDEVSRRLAWSSLAQYTSGANVTTLGAAVGGHLDNIEQGIHIIRSYLQSAAPHHASEVNKILGWGHVMASLREIRNVLRLQAPEDRETKPPAARAAGLTASQRWQRPRAISERALKRIQDAGAGADGITTAEEAQAYLLSLQSEEQPE